MQTELSYYTAAYTKAVDAKTRSVEAVFSSETIDAHGEIVDQGSWKLDRYRKNPIVLFMHSAYEVVGRAEQIRVVGGELVARVHFATTPAANEVFTLFQDGAMRAFSVGFRAGRVSQETIAGKNVRRLLDCELLEVSAVSIPSNPDAVVKHKSLGLVPERFTFDPSAELVRKANDLAFGTARPIALSGDPSLDLCRAADARLRGEGPSDAERLLASYGGTDPEAA